MKKVVKIEGMMCKHCEAKVKEIADKMGISQSYISRLEKRIMLKFKKELKMHLFGMIINGNLIIK